MHRLAFLLVAFVATSGNFVHAARIYNLVDYPDLQNGHTLSGTITTTDDAPDDGLLVTEEILDWEWEISGANVFAGSWDPSPGIGLQPTVVQDIRLSESSIELPLNDKAVLYLNDFFADTSQAPPNTLLHWRAFFNDLAGEYSSVHSLRSPVRDSFINYWSYHPVDTNSTWIIARLVPELSSSMLATISIMLLSLANRIQFRFKPIF